jgi:hypothetical protein
MLEGGSRRYIKDAKTLPGNRPPGHNHSWNGEAGCTPLRSAVGIAIAVSLLSCGWPGLANRSELSAEGPKKKKRP